MISIIFKCVGPGCGEIKEELYTESDYRPRTIQCPACGGVMEKDYASNLPTGSRWHHNDPRGQ
jgi:DNA-directed RNA polymerase subunit RPC12/RpoP